MKTPPPLHYVRAITTPHARAHGIALHGLHPARRAALAVPPKSSWWFCPPHRRSTWADMRGDRPRPVLSGCQLEDLLNARRTRLGRDPVWLA